MTSKVIGFRKLAQVFLSRQFATFVLFGGLAAIVNLAVGWSIYKQRLGIALPYSMAVAVGAVSGLLINFGLNYCFNFTFRERSAIAQFRTFFVVSLGGVALTSLLSWLILQTLPNTISLSDTFVVSGKFASHFIAVGLVTFYSFAAHRYFTFNIGLRARHAQLIQGIQNVRR